MSDDRGRMPPRVISRENAEQYNWGTSCDGWHLVKESDLSVIEEYMPAGTSEVFHYHRKSRQLFFILSGHAVMEIDGPSILLSAGEGVRHPSLNWRAWRRISRAGCSGNWKCETPAPM